MPDATWELVDRYFDLMVAMMGSDYVQINTPLRKAHYLAQVGTETGDLRFMEEKSSGKQYEDNDDLGNTEKGDGARFKGRGLLQMTGRWNYTAYGKHVGKDYITDPNSLLVASDDSVAVDSSGWYWHLKHGNKFADADNVVKVTHRVNGGENGIEDRRKHLQRAKCLLVF
jgi:putative chitinase